MTSPAFAFAAVLLAERATADDGDGVAHGATLVRDAGATQIVVALPSGIQPPSDTRLAELRPGATRISAIRTAMALLTNVPVRHALLWPLPPGGRQSTSLVSLLSLIDAAKREPSAIAAFAGTALDDSPLLIPRDAWLELLTLGEQGMDAVASRRAVTRVRGPDPG